MKQRDILRAMLFLFVMVCNYTYAQTQSIGYAYDNIGNRVQRKLVIVCNGCPTNHRTAAPEVKDTTQVLAIEHGLNVFPNPTQDKVNLTLSNLKDDETTSVVVTDETGKTVYSAKNLQSQNEINVSNFNNGTYFLRVTIDKDVMVYKVMKVQ
jgi:hypothetical protein